MSPLQTTIGKFCSGKSYLLFLKHTRYINVLHQHNVELLFLAERGYGLCSLVSVRVTLEIKDVNAFIPCTSDFLFIEQAHIRAEFDADAHRNFSPTPTPTPSQTNRFFFLPVEQLSPDINPYDLLFYYSKGKILHIKLRGSNQLEEETQQDMFPLCTYYLLVPVGMSAFESHMPSHAEDETSGTFLIDECMSHLCAL